MMLSVSQVTQQAQKLLTSDRLLTQALRDLSDALGTLRRCAWT